MLPKCDLQNSGTGLKKVFHCFASTIALAFFEKQIQLPKASFVILSQSNKVSRLALNAKQKPANHTQLLTIRICVIVSTPAVLLPYVSIIIELVWPLTVGTGLGALVDASLSIILSSHSQFSCLCYSFCWLH